MKCSSSQSVNGGSPCLFRNNSLNALRVRTAWPISPNPFFALKEINKSKLNRWKMQTADKARFTNHSWSACEFRSLKKKKKSLNHKDKSTCQQKTVRECCLKFIKRFYLFSASPWGFTGDWTTSSPPPPDEDLSRFFGVEILTAFLVRKTRPLLWTLSILDLNVAWKNGLLMLCIFYLFSKGSVSDCNKRKIYVIWATQTFRYRKSTIEVFDVEAVALESCTFAIHRLNSSA